MKNLLILTICFLTSYTFSQNSTNNVVRSITIDKAVEMANSCAENILRKYENKIEQGKKLPVNPIELANKCVQDAFNRYHASIEEEANATSHSILDANKDTYLMEYFWKKVDADHSFIHGLYHLED